MALLAASFAWLAGKPQGVTAGAPPTVLFDEGHGQKFLIEGHDKLDLSDLANVFQAAGAQVKSSREELTDARLSGVDGLVVSGAFAPFTAAEIDATTRFLARGGRLAVMLHIPFPVSALLRRLGLDFSNGVIREREDVIAGDALNFHVTRLSPHPLTRDLKAFDVFGAWALLNEGANSTVIARTSPTAWIDLNKSNTLDKGDAVQSFGVAVAGQSGSGRFVVFGDDTLFQNQFLGGANTTLAKNLAAWLTEALQPIDAPALNQSGRHLEL